MSKDDDEHDLSKERQREEGEEQLRSFISRSGTLPRKPGAMAFDPKAKHHFGGRTAWIDVFYSPKPNEHLYPLPERDEAGNRLVWHIIPILLALLAASCVEIPQPHIHHECDEVGATLPPRFPDGPAPGEAKLVCKGHVPVCAQDGKTSVCWCGELRL